MTGFTQNTDKELVFKDASNQLIKPIQSKSNVEMPNELEDTKEFKSVEQGRKFKKDISKVEVGKVLKQKQKSPASSHLNEGKAVRGVGNSSYQS